MKIIIGADHRGVELKNKIKEYLEEEGLTVEVSSIENNDTDDYPDFAFDVGKKVLSEQNALGILICGNGIGISIAANKVKGIRCARVMTSDDAFKAKNHNGANIISFGGIPLEDAKSIVDIFITTKPASDQRHLKRIDKIINYEQHGE